MRGIWLVVVVFALLWLVRNSYRAMVRPGPTRRPPLPPQEEMVACVQCGVHLPRSEGLVGPGGVFCSEGHRAAFERPRS